VAKVEDAKRLLERAALNRATEAFAIIRANVEKAVPDGQPDRLKRPRRFPKLNETMVAVSPYLDSDGVVRSKLGFSAPQALWSDKATDSFYRISAGSTTRDRRGRGSTVRNKKGQWTAEKTFEPGEEYLLFVDRKGKIRREPFVIHPGTGFSKNLGWWSNNVTDKAWADALEQSRDGIFR
jgi:hypothetical protein